MSCKQGLKEITHQITGYLERIDPADYRQPLEVLNGASIGQHFRHILDFYQCLARGASQKIIDYANRERDSRIESDPGFAAAAFAFVIKEINLLDETTPVKLRADFMDIPENERPLYLSSFGREMTFVHDHAVHHMALIKIGIQAQCPGLMVDPNFGVAPSTIKFRTEQQAENRA